MIEAPENTETADLMLCHACGAEQPGRDKFCRRCGASQRLPNGPVAGVTRDSGSFAHETRRLPGIKHYDSFSGALVKMVAQGVSARGASTLANRWTMRLAGMLVTVPLWLMIMLLSPLDAYLAARTIARRI
jgi:ribosomal protein L40E